MMRNQNAGLTILELLVSMAVLAMISVALVSTLSTGQQVWQRSEQSARQADLAVTRHRLRMLIEHIPVASRSEQILTGTKEEFLFLTFPEDEALALDEPVIVSLNVSSGSYEITGLLLDKQRITIHQALASENAVISISYYGAKTAISEKNWHDTWDGVPILPDLIKITIVEENGYQHPPLTVIPGRIWRQREISLSSLSPPG